MKATNTTSNLRLIGGIYQVQIKDHQGRRKTLSLKTSDRREAEIRVGTALQQLRKRIREQAIESTEKVPANTPVRVWDEGGNEQEATAAEVMPEELILDTIDWRGVARAASERRRRMTGADYSNAWYKGFQAATAAAQALSLQPTDLNQPANCLRIVRKLESTGARPATVTQRVSCLAAALTAATRMGHEEINHAFSRVDWRSTAGQKPHREPTQQEVTTIIRGLPSLPIHHQLVIRLMLETGARVGAASAVTADSLEDGGVWLSGKGKPSYWVPISKGLFDAISNAQVTFASPQRIRVILNSLVPTLSPHGLRHFYASQARRAGVAIDVLAQLMNHSLPASLQTSHYGSWDRDRLRLEQEKVRAQLLSQV